MTSKTTLFVAVTAVFAVTGCASVDLQNRSVVSADTILEINSACGLDRELPGREPTASDKQKAENRRQAIAALQEIQVFKEPAQLAVKTLNDYCTDASRQDVDLFERIEAVSNNLKAVADSHAIEWSIEADEDSGGEVSLSSLIDSVMAATTRGAEMPALGFSLPRVNVTFDDFVTTPEDEAACTQVTNGLQAGTTCGEYLEEFYRVYTSVQGLYASSDAAVAAATLRQLDQEWAKFMDETVDQTPLELWWNGIWFRKKYKGARSFVRPPEWQQVFLKPVVAVDWNGEAPDGSEVKEAAVLDVWGIKRWKENRWYVPAGAAIHIAASDRPNTDDVGYGVSIHFTEANTIGLTSYGGDLGVFLSFDLWKNATDEYDRAEDRIEKFRSDADELRRRIDQLGQ